MKKIENIISFCLVIPIIASLGSLLSCKNFQKQQATLTLQQAKHNDSTQVTSLKGWFEAEDSACELDISLDRGQYVIKYNKKKFTDNFKIEINESDTLIIFNNLKHFEALANPSGFEPSSNNLSGLYEEQSIVIQNYGNAMNEYTLFESCPEKYLILKKVSKHKKK